MTRKQLESFWENASDDEKKIQELVLFREESGIEIKNQALNRVETGKMIETAGDMSLITPGKLMKGSYVLSSDTAGCVISQKTAEMLFGDRNVLGKIVSIGERDYIIRGIVDLDIIFCMVQGNENTIYANIRVDAPKLSLSAVQQTLSGLLPKTADGFPKRNLYYGIGRAFSLLPAWKFSDDYIPTAWSDFSFWTELFRQKSDMLFTLLEKPLHIADIIMLKNFVGAITASFVLALSIIISFLLKELLKK